MKKRIFIGCSGYYYSDWKKKFYHDAPAPRWLSEYSKVFNSVELNGTFYKVPSIANLKKQAAQTPDDFKFSVKANRYVTHILKLKNSRKESIEFEAVLLKGLEDKLEKILFQLPPGFHYSEENLETIRKNIPDSDLNAIEFRHISWWNEIVFRFFKSHKYVFCNVDFPGLQPEFINTGEIFYLRLHGVPELFKSAYDTRRLNKISENIPGTCKSYCIYFNNTFYGRAYKNALELKDILNKKLTDEKN